MKRHIPHGILALVGALLVLLSLSADPNSFVGRADIREITRIFGSVLFGLGISGTRTWDQRNDWRNGGEPV